MAPTVQPFYSYASFWAVLIALAALVLSQMPPVRVVFRRTRIQVEPFDRLNITSWLGNPNIHWHLQLRNTGGRQVRVLSLRLVVSTDEGKTCELPAQSFSRPDGTTGSFLFTRFALKPDEEWANFVKFFPQFGLADERTSKQLVKDLKNNIDEKLRRRKAEAPAETGLVEADPALVAPLIDFFKRHNIWRAGEYSVVVHVQCEPARASTSRTFRFLLFESDIQELEERTTRFKYGAGVYFTDATVTELYPRIRELS